MFYYQAQVGRCLGREEHGTSAESRMFGVFPKCCQERSTGRVQNFGGQPGCVYTSLECTVQQATRMVSQGV